MSVPVRLLIFSLVGVLCAAARAEDRIYLKRKGFNDILPTSGVVLEFTGRIIRYKFRNEVREEPAELVDHIDTTYPQAFTRGRQQFDQGQLETARDDWNEALRVESRDWVKREIRTWMIRGHWRLGDWTAATGEFLQIVQADPHSPYWSVAPLIWAPTPVTDADRATARTLLAGASPVARLLGASLLLTDATLGDSAAQTLDGLARDPAPNVAALARAQLWRRRAGVAISDNELAGWERSIEALPKSFRSGPRYLFARARLARSEFDLAAAEFLWVSTVYNEHEPTAARASLDAAEALLRAGRPDDARTMFRETLDQFPWSPAARDARSRLTQLDPPAVP